MKQKLLTLFLVLAASVGTIFAQSGTCGDNLTWTLDTESGTLTISGTGAMMNYTSSSNAPWYSYHSSIKTVTIDNSVTSIGDYVFAGCSSLTSVTIPNSVTSIGERAFQDCRSLTSVTIPNSVTSIGENAFCWCESLTSITIPNSVTSIGDHAFFDCRSLTSPVFNAHVFAKMPESYSGAYTIPDGIESIAGGAFLECWSLTSITIPNSVTSIGGGAFLDCRSLTSVYISDLSAWCKISFDGYNANPLYYAHNLYLNGTLITDLVIPDGVTSIKKYAFNSCSSLTSITIPNSVTSIGEGAFYDCSSLTSITIPNSVTSIGLEAFAGCSSLTSITCEAVNPPTLGNDVFYGVNKSIPLYVPSSAVQQYKLAIGWKAFTNILPIGSQSGDVTTPTVTVTTTSADIAWPQISGAASYELVIKDKSGNVVCTLVFDAEGHLTSLNFGAPDRDNIRKQPQAGTFSFTVTGLKENTEYTYTLTAKDSQGKAIDTKTGTFKTSGGTPVDETERDAAPAPRKQMKNGILRILTPDGITYDLQGHRLD